MLQLAAPGSWTARPALRAAVAVAEVVLREVRILVRARVLAGERPHALAELHRVEALGDVGEPDLPRSLRITGRATVALATAPAGESVVPGLK